MAYSFYLTVGGNNTQFATFSNDALTVEHSELHPDPFVLDTETKTLVVLGTPIIDGQPANESQLARLDLSSLTATIKNFNGQFGMYYLDKIDRSFHAFTDRTAAYPVFYRAQGHTLVCSLSYSDIWKRHVDLNDINHDAFYEFLVLRRLMGTKTFDHQSHYLTAFSHLRFDLETHQLHIAQYNTLDFTKDQRSFNNQAKHLAELITDAVRIRLKNCENPGLLLSGGLDSRVPLAVEKGRFTCFTIGPDFNNEARVASQAAQLDDHQHHFIPMPQNRYDRLYPDGVFLCDGMRDFHSASWTLVAPIIKEYGIDVIFSGYALDYLLGDNYLPRAPIRLFDKYTTRIYKYLTPDEDLAAFFLNTISWRYKSSPVQSLFTSQKPLELAYHTVQNELQQAARTSDVPMDQYLYLTVNSLSRHSMYIESSMVRPFLEDRVPGLDSRLFDQGLKIPYKYRSNYKLYKKAISLIDPRYANVLNANTNYKASYGPLRTTAHLMANRLKRRLGFSATLPPAAHERSWGDKKALQESNNQIHAYLSQHKNFMLWDILPALDADSLGKQIDQHLSGEQINLYLVHHLLSIEALLKHKTGVALPQEKVHQ